MKTLFRLLFVVCAFSFTLSSKGEEGSDVSFFQVKGSCHEYSGKSIRLTGVLDVKHEESFRLFFNFESYDYFVVENSVLLHSVHSFAEVKNRYWNLDGSYVKVSGVLSGDCKRLSFETVQIVAPKRMHRGG